MNIYKLLDIHYRISLRRDQKGVPKDDDVSRRIQKRIHFRIFHTIHILSTLNNIMYTVWRRQRSKVGVHSWTRVWGTFPLPFAPLPPSPCPLFFLLSTARLFSNSARWSGANKLNSQAGLGGLAARWSWRVL